MGKSKQVQFKKTMGKFSHRVTDPKTGKLESTVYGVGDVITLDADSALAKRFLKDAGWQLMETEIAAEPVASPGPGPESTDADKDTGDGNPDGEELTPEQREAVLEAIAGLNPDDVAHFTADGTPDANVLSEMVGFKVSAVERDAIWGFYQENNPANEGGGDDTPDYEISHRGGGYYDIINNTTGEAINEKSMRKEEAEAQVKELNGE